MGFTWSDDVHVKASQYDELKNNINSIRSNIGLSAWTWMSVPVSQGTYITPHNPTDEVRDALDDTDDQNVCGSNYVSQYVPYYATNESVENLGHNTSVQGCSGFCMQHYVPQYISILSNNNVVVNGGCTTVNAQYNASVMGNQLTYQY